MFEEKIIWHEIVKRPPTEEEAEEFERIWGISCAYLECAMPGDGEEVLVAVKYGVDKDICCRDNGIYFEQYDIDDVIAWAAMPKYKGGETDGNK